MMFLVWVFSGSDALVQRLRTAIRSRRLNDPAYCAITAAVAIFGGLDHDVSFVFGSALFGCFGQVPSMTFGKVV